MPVLAQERSDSSRHVNVLFLPLHSIQWASSRYRVYYYAERLKPYGISPRILHPNASTLTAKVVYLVRIVMSLFWADVVVIQKKIFRRPLAWLIHRLHGLTIFDFDDAIYVYDDVQRRLPDVLRASHHVIVGNAHLERYARQYSSCVTRIPSPIDCERFSPKPTKRSNTDVVTIGWIGQGGNQIYLDQLEPVFARLFQLKGNSVRLHVISNKTFQLRDCQITVSNTSWSIETEVEELRAVDIGIMPLSSDEMSKGRCAFKALQYMSLGIATVVSPVGMNQEIIQHGVNGLFADSEEQWVDALLQVIDNPHFRHQLGVAARKTVVQRYSYEATVPQLAELLQRAGASMREVHTSQAECRSQDAAAVTERYGGRSV